MKIKLKINTGYANAGYEDEVEIDNSEIDGMLEEEIEEYINTEYVEPFLHENIEAWYEPAD